MDINSEGRDVNIIPVMGGYIIRWREDHFVEPPKMIEKSYDKSGQSDLKVKSVGTIGQHKIAVRETAEGAMTLVKEILIKKMAFMQKEAQYANGGVSVELHGDKATSGPSEAQATEKYAQPLPTSS